MGYIECFARWIQSSGCLITSILSWKVRGVSIVGALGHPVRYLTQSYPAIFVARRQVVLYATPHGEIYSMAAEGGEPRLILASPAPEGEMRANRWI